MTPVSVTAPITKNFSHSSSTTRNSSPECVSWNPHSSNKINSKDIMMNAVPVCDFPPFSTDGAINTNGSRNRDGVTPPPALSMISSGAGSAEQSVTALVSPKPPVPSPRSAQKSSPSSSGRAALERARADGPLESRRRSGGVGYSFSVEKRVCISKIPASENPRGIADIAPTNNVSTNALNSATILESPFWVAGSDTHNTFEASDNITGANAAARGETSDKSPYVSRSTSASSASGCVQWSTHAHPSLGSSTVHRDHEEALPETLESCVSLVQDNRGFLNPGYSYESVGSDSGTERAGGDDGAVEMDRQHHTPAVSRSRATPAVASSEKRRKDVSAAPPPVAATNHLSDGGRQPTVDFFPLTHVEEYSVRQAYATYTSKQKSVGHRRGPPSDLQSCRRSCSVASSSSLSRSTSFAVRRLLRLLRGLYHRAHIITCMARSTKSISAAPQRKGDPQSKWNCSLDVTYKPPAPEELLDMAETCFGTHRFKALMAAVTAGRAASPVRSPCDGRDPLAVCTESRSQYLESGAQGLTVEEAISFLSHLKYTQASGVFRQRGGGRADHPVNPAAVAGYKDREDPVKVVLSRPSQGPQTVQMAPSTSPGNRRADHRSARFPHVQASRPSCRPPAFPIAWTTACFSPSSERMSKVSVLVAPRKPKGNRRRPCAAKAHQPPSSLSYPSSASSCIHDTSYEDCLIQTYVQRKAFAEIADGQCSIDSSTVTLGRLAEVLSRFELALNLSAVERVCGIPSGLAPEPQNVSIDFSAFAKIIDWGLHCRRYEEASRSSSTSASVSAYQNEERPEVMLLLLRPESSARGSPLVPLFPSRSVTDAALLTSGGGAVPRAQGASYPDSWCCGEASSQRPYTAAGASAAYHRLSSFNSATNTSASSPASGASAHRSFETDDAYPLLVAHDSAIAVLCRSIRQRLRQALRRSVSGGPDALRSSQDIQGSDSSWGGCATQKGGEESNHSSPAVDQIGVTSRSSRPPTASHSFGSPSAGSTAAVSELSRDVSAICLDDERDSIFALRDSQEFSTSSQVSKQINASKSDTQLLCQWPHEPSSPSSLVVRALFDHPHSYALKPEPRELGSQRDSCADVKMNPRRSQTMGQRMRHGGQHHGAPPADAALRRGVSHLSGGVRPSHQYRKAMDFFAFLSPYCAPNQVTRRLTFRRRPLSADGIKRSLFTRSSSLLSSDTGAVFHGLSSAASNSRTASVSRSLPGQSKPGLPQRYRPASAHTRFAAAPPPIAHAVHMPHPPFAPSTRSMSLRSLSSAPSDKVGRRRIRSL